MNKNAFTQFTPVKINNLHSQNSVNGYKTCTGGGQLTIDLDLDLESRLGIDWNQSRNLDL